MGSFSRSEGTKRCQYKTATRRPTQLLIQEQHLGNASYKVLVIFSESDHSLKSALALQCILVIKYLTGMVIINASINYLKKLSFPMF